MHRKDKLPHFTVKVENGSGCLFQPTSNDYSYVLTAKHVLDNNIPTIIRQILDENGDVINEPIEIIGEPFLHSDPNKDAAIIKIKKIEGIDSLIRANLFSEDKDNYYLCGHPNSRINDNYSFRENKLTIETTKPFGYIEAELARLATRNEIIGQSGGGIIKLEHNFFLLGGIQKKMSVSDKYESLGRIDFMPISFFDEIVNQNIEELSNLYPPYIASFERLITDIFPLTNLFIKKVAIQNVLKSIAKHLCEDFTPEAILELFDSDFLVHGTDTSIINHKQLWIAFLELLAYNQLHSENKITLNDLKELHKKRKLFIADTDDWTKKIEDIYKTDLSQIEKGGSIIICATNETKPSLVEIEAGLLIDISTPVDEMNISNTVRNPFSELKLANIYKFQSYIITNAIAYTTLNSTNSKELIKQQTNGII